MTSLLKDYSEKPKLANLIIKFFDGFLTKYENLPNEIQSQEEEYILNMKNELIKILHKIESHENYFFTHKELLKIKDLLKHEKINTKEFPKYIKNSKTIFTKAHGKLASFLKFSTPNLINYTPTSEFDNSNSQNLNFSQIENNLSLNNNENKENSNGSLKKVLN